MIAALIITNLFIFLYNNILRFLNANFPTSVPSEFIRIGASPEPYEISLYLILAFFFVFIIWILGKNLKKSNLSSPYLKFFKYGVLIFLAVLFLYNIGPYPLARSLYPYPQAELPAINFLFLFSFLALAAAIVIEGAILDKLVEKNNRAKILFFMFVALLITFLTFEPGFPIVGHDYSYFLGPIWEVAHGKTIYTQVSSQYGFLSILFFTFLYKIQVLDPAYLPAIVWFFYIIEYFLVFYLVYKISKSLPLSLIALFSAFTLNYFSIYHLPASIPQIGPLRWLPLVASLFFLYKFRDITSRKFIFLLSLVSLWVLDSGISLLLSYIFTLFLLYAVKSLDLKAVFKAVTTILCGLILIFMGINLAHLAAGYKLVNLISVFAKFSQYASAGFGMIPIDSYSHFWLVILLYFASVIYFLSLKTGEANIPDLRDLGGPSRLSRDGREPTGDIKSRIELQTLIFSANLMFFASVYFVGRSHIHNLFHLSIFPILNFFILFGLIYKNHVSKNDSRFLIFIFQISIFILLVAYPAFQRQEVMTKLMKEKISRFQVGQIFKPEWPETLQKKYAEEVKMIKKSIKDKQIVILSPDDTYLFYLTGYENLLNDNSQITILTKKDVDLSLAKTFSTCPSKIVADCTLFKKCADSKPFSVVAFFSIQPILLNRIQEVCKISYKPSLCTSKLCIAEKIKQ